MSTAILAGFSVGMMASYISFAAMILVLEIQQRAVFLIFPILALVIGQFSGVILVNSGLLLGLGVVLAVLAVLLMRGAARSFTYEKMLK